MALIVGPEGLAKAACFYAKKLGIDNEDFTVLIERTKLGKALIGSCDWDAEERVGVIQLDPRNHVEPVLSVLAHEMVHIKQFVTGQMSSVGDTVIWEGVSYKETTEDEYWDSPWEIEAFGRQLGLYIRYKNKEE